MIFIFPYFFSFLLRYLIHQYIISFGIILYILNPIFQNYAAPQFVAFWSYHHIPCLTSKIVHFQALGTASNLLSVVD
jgi:hypothetical protein